MRKILLASHGKTASGIKSTIDLFLGNLEITCIDAYVQGQQDNFMDTIHAFITAMKDDDEAYIFTDIVGGSVHQKVVGEVLKSTKKNIVVITNMNVAIVIELLTSPKMKTVEEINSMVMQSNMMPMAIETSILLNKQIDTGDNDSFLD